MLEDTSQRTQQIGRTDASIGSSTTAIGGNSAEVVALAPPIQAEQADEGGSTPLLWLVFAAGILVFIAGVVGSILIFTRQREDQN